MAATPVIPHTTYLAPRDADRLRERAKAADRSVAGEIRHAIRHHLSESNKSEAAPADGSAKTREATRDAIEV